jgi:acetyl-CoA acetyltransferase
LADAGLSPRDVDGIVPSSIAGRIAEDFIREFGARGLPFAPTIHAGGASYGMAIQEACLAIYGGVASCVLIPAGRLGYSSTEQRVSRSAQVPTVMSDIGEFELPYGNFGPAQWFAQAARRHMFLYGTTSEQLGTLAVTIRRHANLNPQALMYGRTLTLEQHQQSRIVVDPFHLFDCSLETDGAAAIVVTSADRARDLRQTPVYLAGVGASFGYPGTSITQQADIASVEGIGYASRRAFAMAQMETADIHCVQIHEGFSWFVLACLEAMDFCKPGESGPFIADGNVALGARLPLNTHGGSLSEAHVSGANHVVEAVRQIRHTVEPERQVEGCETALVANEGNFGNGTVIILKR